MNFINNFFLSIIFIFFLNGCKVENQSLDSKLTYSEIHKELIFIKTNLDSTLSLNGWECSQCLNMVSFGENFKQLSLVNKDLDEYISLDISANKLYNYERFKIVFDSNIYHTFGILNNDTLFNITSSKKHVYPFYRKQGDNTRIIKGKYYVNFHHDYDENYDPKHIMNQKQKEFYEENKDSLINIYGDDNLPPLPEKESISNTNSFLKTIENDSEYNH